MTKEEIKARQNHLIELTTAFCIKHVDKEYSRLCRKLIKLIGKEKEVPFKRGRPEIWAASVIYTIGTLNFLFDKSFKPYIPSKKINEYFQTNSVTISNKAAAIKKMFNLWHYDQEFSTKHMHNSNPFNELVFLDDMIVNIDTLPEDIQQTIRETRAKGDDVFITTKPS